MSAFHSIGTYMGEGITCSRAELSAFQDITGSPTYLEKMANTSAAAQACCLLYHTPKKALLDC